MESNADSDIGLFNRSIDRYIYVLMDFRFNSADISL
jgi:hypothetical protein